jgi:ABC-type cobalamin/Fe3+-siderophores transport system ATPase subunit
MRLKRLWLGDYKNLRDVTIEFRGSETTILLGQNGTGKSNLIEALVEIFAALYQASMPNFEADLTYTCSGCEVQIRSRPEVPRGSTVHIDGKRVARSQLKDRRDELLPRSVFAYYSGPSNRLLDHFVDSQRRFYDALIREEPGSTALPLRPLFYAQPVHSQFVLLANDASVSPKVAEIVRRKLEIESVESVLFVLRRPDWSHGGRTGAAAKTDRYWGATGEVRTLLDRIDQIAFAPAGTTESVRLQFNKRSRRQERRLLYLPDSAHLGRLVEEYESPRDFFKALESLYISDMLEEVRIRVRRTDGEQMTFTELSEGEQQLLTVLGLIAFTGEEESLFLLDEPDTHINPNWASEYVRDTADILDGAEGTHVLMATHDPIVVGEVKREDILLFELQESDVAGDRRVKVHTPSEAPRGLGVEGVLTGEFFQLTTTLDRDTQEKLEERYELELRQLSDEITEAERERMVRLSNELEQLGFAITVRDPLFSEYLRARAEIAGDPAMDRRLSRALSSEALKRAIKELQ